MPCLWIQFSVTSVFSHPDSCGGCGAYLNIVSRCSCKKKWRQPHLVSGQCVFINPIWNFLLKVLAGGEAQCKTCGLVLKSPTGMMTTLVPHLKRHQSKHKGYMELHLALQLAEKIVNRRCRRQSLPRPVCLSRNFSSHREKHSI